MLPNLPKQNKKQEADSSLIFRKWWEKNGMNAPYEMKDSRGKDRILFSEISDDQIRIGLMANSDKGVLIRVERGTVGSPDYIGFKNSPYWIVIKYPKSFEVIGIQTFMLERQKKAKSLTYERAKSISTTSIKLSTVSLAI